MNIKDHHKTNPHHLTPGGKHRLLLLQEGICHDSTIGHAYHRQHPFWLTAQATVCPDHHAYHDRASDDEHVSSSADEFWYLEVLTNNKNPNYNIYMYNRWNKTNYRMNLYIKQKI